MPFASLTNAETVYATESPKLGDFNGDGSVDSDDAIHLLMHTLFEKDYPLNQKVLFNNGVIDSDAAIYLLMYTLFPEEYPIDGSEPPTPPTPPQPPKPYVRESIKKYQNSESVREMKQALNKLGFTDSKGNKLIEDIVYDGDFYFALYAFQEDFDLDPDGNASVGGWTWNLIDKLLKSPFKVTITANSASISKYRQQSPFGTVKKGETYTGMVVDGNKTYLKEVEGWVENTAYGYNWHGATNEESIYKYLTGVAGLKPAATCGIMANIQNESAYLPNNLENFFTTKYNEYGLNLTDEVYTRNVDNGTYMYKRVYHNGKPDRLSDITVTVDIGSVTRKNIDDNAYASAICSNVRESFGNDKMGYGLCQWTTPAKRKLGLYDMAKSQGKSIADIGVQLDFLLYEFENSYSSVYSEIKACSNDANGAYKVADVMCRKFEAPAKVDTVAPQRGNLAKTLFAKYNK